MLYISTRDPAASGVSFSTAVLQGLAGDGGLFVPQQLPSLPSLVKDGHKMPLIDFATDLVVAFTDGDDNISRNDIKQFLKNSLAVFEKQMEHDWQPAQENRWLLELYHGPTLSFKDVAMQFLAPLFQHLLQKTNRRTTILAATSGDTGSAAIHAFKGLANIQLVVFHPYQHVSEIQRRQMTTVKVDNIYNIALVGVFDDCQDMVKKLFADNKLSAQYHFSAVNSINWARIVAQMVYYARAAVLLHQRTGEKINLVVPTGNFGNMLAAYYVKRMGFPIDQLLVATNENDILFRFFADNDMTVQGVKTTWSPSMDIQISSNVERYLFEVFNRDGALVAKEMTAFRTTGKMKLEPAQHEMVLDDFAVGHLSMAEELNTIRKYYEEHQKTIDPHTAVAVGVLDKWLASNKLERKVYEHKPWLVIGTAAPQKFKLAIENAIGKSLAEIASVTGEDLSEPLLSTDEYCEILSNDRGVVEQYLKKRLHHF